MKKLGQKFSFLTKILLVFGLLISNLSSLSVVFAYEVSEDVVVTLNEELLKISYTEELAEEVEEVKVKVYENYTYSGGLSEQEVLNVYSLTAEELLAAAEGTLEVSYNSIFVNEENVVNNYELFDGTYSVKVEIVDVTDYSDEDLVTNVGETENTEVLEENYELQTTETENTESQEVVETVLAVGTYEEVMEHKSGLNIKLYNSNDEEITLVDGKYPVSLDDTKVTVVAQVLSGGLNPTDVFEYDGVEYVAKDLLAQEFRAEKEFAGYLFGEYELPVEVTLLRPLENTATETTNEVLLTEEVSEDEYEEVVYADSVNIMYGAYELNASVLNEVLVNEEIGELYLFDGDTKDGVLYSLTEFNQVGSEIHVKSMLDLYNVVTAAIDGDEALTYQLLKDGVNVLDGYDEATATQTLEEYLSSIGLDDTVVLSISGNGLTVTYRVVMVADLNNDNTLTQEDLLELVDQVIGESEVADLEKSDVITDGELSLLDVLYLKEIIESQSWDASITVSEATLDASLNVVTGDKEELVSGDEFTVEYVLSLEQLEAVSGFSGLFEYDKESLELVSVEALTDWKGNYSKESGKFLYFGEESLVGPEEVITENEEQTEQNTDESTSTEEIVTEDYVLLTANFKALKAGSHTITIKENEYFNDNTYLDLSEELVASTEIVVAESEDNTLSYLEVAGQEITLEENKFEYEITVSNDVTLVDLKYIVTNVAANVTSTVYPEELAEGTNTVVVTVTSESGVSQDYTITVVREEAVKENTTTQVSNNYYGDYDNDNDEEVVVTPGSEQDDDSEDDTTKTEESNLSRVVIIILILLVIAGLVYLIFKDDEDEETKKANKDVNKLKKESIDATTKSSAVKEVSKTSSKSVNKTDGKKTSSSNKNKKPNNKKKER